MKSWCIKFVAEPISFFLQRWIIYASHIQTFKFIKKAFCLNIKHSSHFWKFITRRSFKICARSIVKSWIFCIQLSCISISKILGSWYTTVSTKMISCSPTKVKTQLIPVLMPKSLSNVCLNLVMRIQHLKELHKVLPLKQLHQRVKTTFQE